MSTEVRVRTAGEATAASVREIRPLNLPGTRPVTAEPRQYRGRNVPRASWTLVKFKETWLIPLGAAAVVVAVALTLVSFRHTAVLGPAPTSTSTVTPAVAGIPRYYAIATEGPVSHSQMAAIDVTVGDVYTGKAVASVALPAASELAGNSAVAGVSATADDRSFVVGRRDLNGDTDYFVVHIAPGAKQAATVAPLPVPAAKLGAMLGFAVSPDGTQLAVLSVRGNGTTLRIYSVKSGATLRTWTAGTWSYQGDGILLTGVSWTADNRNVAFSTITTGRYPSEGSTLEERLIGAAAPSGNLASASKVMLKAPGSCASLLLTPDGGTVVCATQTNSYGRNPLSGPPSQGSCGDNQPMLVAYSASTGQRLRVLYQYPGACKSGEDTVLWSDASARHVIAESDLDVGGDPVDGYGVAIAGGFAKIRIAKHGQEYSGPAF
jgi:hypothetical protein